jgi:hypothetical protein
MKFLLFNKIIWLVAVTLSLTFAGRTIPNASPLAENPLVTDHMHDLFAAVKTMPEFADIPDDRTLQEQFDRYLRWAAKAESPDAVYLTNRIDHGLNTFDLQADVFHELIELRNWMRLGHTYADIMTLEYYQKHYPAVYPQAHCNAIIAETLLLNRFAEINGFQPLPALAYAMASPMYELYERLQGVDVPILVRKLRYNRTLFEEPVTPDQVTIARRIYEIGGYTYKDADSLQTVAAGFLRQPRDKWLELLRIEDGISDCQPIPAR